MTNPRALLDYALAYYDQGLCVIPAIYGEKKPAVEWKRYQKERPSREQVVKWFQDQDGKRNIAIVCGEVSGNLTVIDFDDPSVYPRFFDTAKVEAATPVVKTARGVQVYLRSGKPVETFKLPELHVEVRGNGSLVIAPPSLHPSGSHYEFKNRLTEIQMVAALEEAVWRRVEELGVRRRIYVDPSWRFQGTGAYRGPDPPCITWLLKGVVKGLRHDAAIRLLSYWINFRHERPKAALDKAKDWNRRNEEPLPEQELADIYKDVVKEPYNYGCTDTLYRCGCNPANCEIGKHKPSEEALTKAEAFMKDPVGFIQYLQQCLEYRLTGEQKNRLFIFLVAAGAGVQTSVIRITGPNSVGKNQLIRWLQEFFGADRVIAISSATVNWLKRKVMRGLDTRGKIFILLEERGEREGAFKYQFEQIYSEDKVIIGLNVRDKETGEWEPVEVELQGPLCFITTSTELE
ncbi:MAG: bifunctional DNA primase/polymerase, partial [Candidatus Bathyarchaeia archaeon]